MLLDPVVGLLFRCRDLGVRHPRREHRDAVLTGFVTARLRQHRPEVGFDQILGTPRPAQ